LEAAKAYHQHLDLAMPYLAGDRALTREEAEAFRLGFVKEPVTEEHEQYVGRLCIPYMTPTGIVNLKFRCTEHGSHEDCKPHGHPKYYSLSGYGVRLYNVLALMKDATEVVVTEGEMDAVAVQSKLGIPAVGYPGATQWSGNPHWPLIFEGYSTVYVIADGDKPGREAAKEVARTLRNARVIQCPDEQDANDLVKTGDGRQWLADRLGIEA